MIAMKGKECVAIASDRRFGVNQGQTVATDFDVSINYWLKLLNNWISNLLF